MVHLPNKESERSLYVARVSLLSSGKEA
jgi:hypothetical protein